MTDLPLDNQRHLSLNFWDSSSYHESYILPIIPKVCSIINMIAAMFAGVLTVLVTIANSHTNSDIAVVLSKLIFCFLAGAVVAFLSALLDYVARLLYKIEARNGPSFWKYGEVVDCVAVGMAIASAGVFCWGVWCAFTALRGVDVHF